VTAAAGVKIPGMLAAIVGPKVMALPALAGGVVASAGEVLQFPLFGWAGLTLGICGTLYGARSYAKQKTGEVWEHTASGWKEEAAAQSARADRMELERDEQREMKHKLRSDLAAERLKTDVTGVLERMSEQHSEVLAKVTDAFSGLTGRANEAEERVLEQITQLSRGQAAHAAILERVVDKVEQLTAGVENLAELKPLGTRAGDNIDL
jgi:oligoendopeptidase F